MTTYTCTPGHDRTAALAAAAAALAAGQLVVTPTDTVYGVACDAFSPAAVAALLAAKHRGPDMPVPVLVGSWQAAEDIAGELPTVALALMKAYWPGGLSVVVPQAQSVEWDLGETTQSVMLRMPLNAVAVDLLRRTGPLGVSSANITGHPPATAIEQAEEQLGESVAIYLDGGPADIGTASTIVDVTCDPPRIIREGAITADDIARVVGVRTTVLLRPAM